MNLFSLAMYGWRSRNGSTSERMDDCTSSARVEVVKESVRTAAMRRAVEIFFMD